MSIKIKAAGFLILLVFTAGAPTSSKQSPQYPSIVFTRVTVIDATGAAAKPSMTVVIIGDRISEIGKSEKVHVPVNAKVIDASGKFLIPGLWDMHVHWNHKEYLPLFTANGVTGVRIMIGLPIHQVWRKEIEGGTLLGPRMVIASPSVDGPNPVSRYSVRVSNEKEARQAVSKLREDGADFIKVYSLIPRDAYFALADAAIKQKIPFAGHVPRSVTVAEVSDSGQRSIEHLSGFAFAASAREIEVEAELVELRKALAAGGNYLMLLRRLEAKHLDFYDGRKAAALFKRLHKNGTWQCPTLVTMRGSAFLDDPTFTNDLRLKYLPATLRTNWKPQNHNVYRNARAADYAAMKKILNKQLEIVRAARSAGVQFLAGTDVTNPYCFPGFSLHDELELLVRAGLTPLEALQTATLNPAKYLGLLNTLGTVEKGKIADLVLLDKNPLTDIANTKRINAVMMAGKLILKSDLEAMLAKVEATATRSEHGN